MIKRTVAFNRVTVYICVRINTYIPTFGYCGHVHMHVYIFLMKIGAVKCMRSAQSVMSKSGHYVYPICWHRCHLKYAPTWKKFDRFKTVGSPQILVQGILAVVQLYRRPSVFHSMQALLRSLCRRQSQMEIRINLLIRWFGLEVEPTDVAYIFNSTFPNESDIRCFSNRTRLVFVESFIWIVFEVRLEVNGS